MWFQRRGRRERGGGLGRRKCKMQSAECRMDGKRQARRGESRGVGTGCRMGWTEMPVAGISSEKVACPLFPPFSPALRSGHGPEMRVAGNSSEKVACPLFPRKCLSPEMPVPGNPSEKVECPLFSRIPPGRSLSAWLMGRQKNPTTVRGAKHRKRPPARDNAITCSGR